MRRGLCLLVLLLTAGAPHCVAALTERPAVVFKPSPALIPVAPNVRLSAQLAQRKIQYVAIDYDETLATKGRLPAIQTLAALDAALKHVHVDIVTENNARLMGYYLQELPDAAKPKLLVAAVNGQRVGRIGGRGMFKKDHTRSLPNFLKGYKAVATALAEDGLSIKDVGDLKFSSLYGEKFMLNHPNAALAERLASSIRRHLASVGNTRPAITHNESGVDILYNDKRQYVLSRINELGLRPEQVVVVGNEAYPKGGDWNMFQIDGALKIYVGHPRDDVPPDYMRMEASGPSAATTVLRQIADYFEGR